MTHALPMTPATSSVLTATNSSILAFDKGGFSVTMELSKPLPQDLSYTKVLCRFTNKMSTPITDLNFQAAVPKYLKLEMLPPSNTLIPPNSTGQITQEIKLTNSEQGKKNIMLKLKIGYKNGENTVDELAQVTNFPNLY